MKNENKKPSSYFVKYLKKKLIEQFSQAKEICIWLQKEKERKKKKLFLKDQAPKVSTTIFCLKEKTKEKTDF